MSEKAGSWRRLREIYREQRRNNRSPSLMAIGAGRAWAGVFGAVSIGVTCLARGGVPLGVGLVFLGGVGAWLLLSRRW